METEKYRASCIVRVDREIEEMIEFVGDMLGYNAFTIRNLALILGLSEILRLSRVWKIKLDNKVMWDLFEELRKEVDRYAKSKT